MPAPAVPTGGCRYCPVRARCTEGWARGVAEQPRAGGVDVEIETLQEPTDNGFRALLHAEPVHVVYETAVGTQLPALGCGERLRLVNATMRDDGSIQIRSWTEVLVLTA